MDDNDKMIVGLFLIGVIIAIVIVVSVVFGFSVEN